MNNNTIVSLSEYTQQRFSHIFLMAKNFNLYLNTENINLKDNIIQLEEVINNEALRTSNKNYTVSEFKKLWKEDPKQAQEFLKPHGYKMYDASLKLRFELSSRIFPSILWSSLLVMIIAHFENSLLLICDTLAIEQGEKLTIKHISGNSISEKAKIFLNKVLVINFDFGLSEHWKDIRMYRKIRNVIIHHGGYLKDSDYRDLKTIIENSNIINLAEDSLVSFDIKFVDQALTSVSLFFEELFSTILEK